MKQTIQNGIKPLTSGIYQIKNTVNNKIYIGSSINLKQRFNDHKKLLRYNKHPNKHLQSAWVKYGEPAFIFKIIENIAVDFLLIREQYYIDLFSSHDRTLGYNISKIAGNTLGTKRTEQQKINLSLSKLPNNKKRINTLVNIAIEFNDESTYVNSKNIGNTGKNNKRSKPVIQLDVNMSPIKEWDSAGIAAKALNLSVGNIWMCCNNKYRTAYGFIWKYKSDL